MRGLGIDWDEEDAAEQAARQPRTTKKQEPLAVQNAPANAVVPPSAVAQPAAAPAPAAPPNAKPKQPQSFAESIIRKAEPYFNPIHLKPGITEYSSYQDIDPYATAAHGLGEYLAYQHGIKPIIAGVTQGIGNRISNAISGVDPTIKAQIRATEAKIQSSEKIAAMKYGQAQGPDRPVVPTVAGRIEPTFDTTPVPVAEAAPDVPPVIAKTPEEPLAKPNPLDTYSQQKHGYTLAELEAASGGPLKNPADIDIVATSLKNGRGITVNTLPGVVSNAPAGIPSGVNPMNRLTNAAQPPIAPAVTPPAPSVGETVATGGNVGQAVKQTVANELDAVPPPQELRTGTGKPAFAGQGPATEIRAKGKKAGEPMLRNNYARVEDVPAGYAFVPGAQHIDTSRTNIGQTEYTKAYTNRPFPSTNELAVQESNEINRLLGRPTRAEAKAAGITLPPQTPGITKHVLESKGTPFMGTKAAKVGGVLGALIAIPDLVNAQTAGQRGMAGANMLEAVLPPGFTMSNVGEGSGNVPNVSPAALLGSPYAQTDWAKTQRLREKAGAGRGIAPPSAYR
jgi:hypothetical protein